MVEAVADMYHHARRVAVRTVYMAVLPVPLEVKAAKPAVPVAVIFGVNSREIGLPELVVDLPAIRVKVLMTEWHGMHVTLLPEAVVEEAMEQVVETPPTMVTRLFPAGQADRQSNQTEPVYHG